MRIEYDATLDDIADAHLRALARSKLHRRGRWFSTVWSAVLSGALVLASISYYGGTPAERFVFVGVAVVICAGGTWLTYDRIVKKRLLVYLREQMQSGGPVHFAVELRDDCIWTKQGGTQLSFDWSNVAELSDSEDGVELRMRDGGFVIVRSKGFSSDEAQRDFNAIANNLLQGHVATQPNSEK